MVVKDDNTIEQRAIQVEQYNDNSWIVLDGLEEGERVAVSNLQNLRAGVTVDPISSAA
ncbi:MAG TPA: efflux transporter periplasmic adaptor subunit, partial [Hyphomonas sp.]|nr:efflux transporter periplasmic adaptor subunit [Hyphomonas sp.]